MSPQRIQLRRAAGWRKPAGAIVVARPSRWGNPNVLERDDQGWIVRNLRSGLGIAHFTEAHARRVAVDAYRAQLTDADIEEARRVLAGHDLACWCRLDQPVPRGCAVGVGQPTLTHRRHRRSAPGGVHIPVHGCDPAGGAHCDAVTSIDTNPGM